MKPIAKKPELMPQKPEPIAKKPEPMPQKLEPMPQKLEPMPQKPEPMPQKPEPIAKKLEPMPQKLEPAWRLTPINNSRRIAASLLSTHNPTCHMNLVNTNKLEELTWSSPKGKFVGAGKEVSEALGRKPGSSDLKERHPFDVEILRVPPGTSPYPYHSHSAQWEFYHVISGTGIIRHEGGHTPIEPGDAFLFEPGQPHQLINDSTGDLIVYVVADNPFGESCHYPDSNKWLVRSPERRLLSSDPLDYFDGEE
jgi:uncharacterized cupin superfamily protein